MRRRDATKGNTGRRLARVAVASAAMAALAAALPGATQAQTTTQAMTPGRAASQQRFPVSDFHGSAALAVLSSRDLDAPQPDITRVVITIHGRDRDADTYNRIAEDGLAKAGPAGAGTLLITPRLAAPGDQGLAADTLRWRGTAWMAGGAAAAPAAITSFEALDALLARLGDRSRFPALRTIVLAGHSGGGQLVQRYAVLGHEPTTLLGRGLAVRFLVANPSSYSYFTADRPVAGGGFAPFPSDQCHRFNDWKYGMQGLPDYAEGATASALERDYVQRDVTYLLGTADTDPALPALDKSCAAEAQGATHLERGRDFVRYLRLRHPVGLNQYEYDIAGVGHDATAMLTSDCAIATIYDAPLCGHAPTATPVAPHPAPVAPIRPVPTPAPPKRDAARHAPPPPIPHRHPHERYAAPARGWEWQPGSWSWNGESYVWVPGHRVRRAPTPMMFVPAAWQFNGVDWIWVPAHWQPAG